jgi:hypothetical protein
MGALRSVYEAVQAGEKTWDPPDEYAAPDPPLSQKVCDAMSFATVPARRIDAARLGKFCECRGWVGGSGGDGGEGGFRSVVSDFCRARLTA